MSDQEPERSGEFRPLTSLLSQPTGSLSRSSYWTDEEIGRALQFSIQRHLRAGWKWEPPYLVKGQVKARPSTLMAPKSPASAGFDPAKDAFAFRISPHVEYIGNGRYRLGNLLMHHDGTLIDRHECLECGGFPWLVRVPHKATVTDHRGWESTFTYCRTCVSSAEVEDAKQRALTYAEQGKRVRAKARK